MMMSTTRPQLRAGTAGARSVVAPRPLALRSTLRVRASEEEGSSNGTTTQTVERQQDLFPADRKQQTMPEIVPTTPLTQAAGTSGKPLQEFTVFNSVTEAINGRAAMVGIFAALFTELSTHQAVWSQFAGRYQDLEMVERPSGQAFLAFAAVVVFTTLASNIPKQLTGENAENRAWGPFTATAELWNGRAAQVGFFLLVITEWIKGSALF